MNISSNLVARDGYASPSNMLTYFYQITQRLTPKKTVTFTSLS